VRRTDEAAAIEESTALQRQEQSYSQLLPKLLETAPLPSSISA
jgi:hypothetical protein